MKFVKKLFFLLQYIARAQTFLPLCLKAMDPAAMAAAVSAATSDPGYVALILKLGLSMYISSGRPQY